MADDDNGNRKVSRPFGVAVRRLLRDNRWGYHDVAGRAGVHPSAVIDMTQGVVPDRQIVVKFAHGLSLNENEWLALAGYPPLPSVPLVSRGEPAAQHLVDGLTRLSQLYHPTEWGNIGVAEELTLNDVDHLLDWMEAKLRQERIGK